MPLGDVQSTVQGLAYSITSFDVKDQLRQLTYDLKYYGKTVEKAMCSVRNYMYKTEWKKMVKIKTEDYVLPVKRAMYVKARDELEKAKQAVKSQKWDDVLNHLRPAIDLAIKEKFGFNKIFPMKQFILDAEKENLPLPSYALLYDYFDEGSQRIHAGKLHTPWECEKALGFVAQFIDRLDLINVTQEDIDEFKRKSKTVD